MAGVEVGASYALPFPYTGLALGSSATSRLGNLLSKTRVDLVDRITSGSKAQHTEAWFPYVDKKSADIYKNGSGTNDYKRIVTEMHYDDDGNRTALKTMTTEAASGDTFVRDVTASYETSDTSSWCLSLPTTVTQTNTNPDGAQASRTTRYTVDTSACRITSKTIAPNQPLALTTSFQYDGFGNVNKVTESGSGIGNRVTQVNYGASGDFPVSITDPAGETKSFTWNHALGVKTSATAVDNTTTHWTYDGFGRQASETNPDGSVTTTAYAFCGSGCPTHGRYSVSTTLNDHNGNAGGQTSVIYDRLNRPIQTRRAILGGNTAVVDSHYDALGRKIKVSQPYLLNAGAQYWTTYAYDVRNRVTQKNAPLDQDHPSGRMTRYAYDGLTTTVTDPMNHVKTVVDNALGEAAQVTDDASSNPVTYTDGYTPFGQLATVTDPNGNKTTYSYDPRGFKTAMNDPDMGAWSYAYNAAGELTKQTDAQHRTTTQSYDALGRPASRSEPLSGETRHIAYHYVQSGNGKGHLANETLIKGSGSTPDFKRAFTYDALGRPTTVTTTIADVDYKVKRAYDGFSRLRQLTYPESAGGEHLKLNYTYDPSGVVKQVTDANDGVVYWTALSMDAMGHVTGERRGDGVSTVTLYDPATGALNGISSGSGANDSHVQYLTYKWDAMNNMTERRDARLRLSEDFTYDALNRLTRCRLTKPDGSLGGTQSFTYDPLGNLLSKSGVGTYTYDTIHPHRVTSINRGGGVSNHFQYSADGNLMSKSGPDGYTNQFTAFNKPREITTEHTARTFAYGPEHRRYAQFMSGSGAHKYYVGTLFEVIDQASVITYRHNIQVNGRTIAIGINRSDNTHAIRYVYQDGLGSTDAITNYTGKVMERMSFDAFGQRRSETSWSGPPSGDRDDITDRGYTGAK
jgi:YD repeat-containing protein